MIIFELPIFIPGTFGESSDSTSAAAFQRHQQLSCQEYISSLAPTFFLLFPPRFISMKFKAVTFIDSSFINCYFEDVTSVGSSFINCTIVDSFFYNTGEFTLALALPSTDLQCFLLPRRHYYSVGAVSYVSLGLCLCLTAHFGPDVKASNL